jgi:hypothetical protein
MRKIWVVVLILFLGACGSNNGAKDAGETVVGPGSDTANELPDAQAGTDLRTADNDLDQSDSNSVKSDMDSRSPDMDAKTQDSDSQILEVNVEIPDPDVGCTPECAGMECGDDGCGGECGQCMLPDTCQDDGTCVCPPQCDGIECGNDGCGGICGECSEGSVCTMAGTCCTPACEALECGPDGCGGTCGQCDGAGLCQEGLCCYPACDGKECGEDGCGGDCGMCPAGKICTDGHCLADPVFIGCSDGTREGFVSLGTYPLIAACGGAWDVPGIHNVVPACNRESGNSGLNAPGTGCNVTDLCAEGWHVCLGRDDVDYRSPLGCVEIMVDAPSPAFFLVRTSSTGAMNCAPDTIGEPTSINDIFGCGDLGCPANEASCEPLQVASHNLCKSIRNKPTSGCTCHFPGDLDPTDPKYKEDDFENVFCTPNSGGCGWCKPLDYYNKKYGVSHPDAWDCGTNSTEEAINVIKSNPEQQGGVLCCQHQCQVDLDCDVGMVCLMSTCQLP